MGRPHQVALPGPLMPDGSEGDSVVEACTCWDDAELIHDYH
jgi:hypothetical protein